MFIGDIIEAVIESIWFMMPAYAATIIPIYVRKINFLDYPVNEKLFGKNKTYRGFLFGILSAILIVYLQVWLYNKYFVMRALSIVLYDRVDYVLFGFLLGFGSLSGDLVKSYFKRKAGIKEGRQWLPYDSIDYVIGALVFISFIFVPSLVHLIIIIILSTLLHYSFVRMSYNLKIR